jgi:ABC-type dipeptide/oligopeptide/nickel transport system ATPase component
MFNASLCVRDLTICFPLRGGPVIPVRDFNLVLKRGEILGLAGPSGCGKTVFCTALLGMVEAPGYIKSGSIRYVRESGETLDLTSLSEKQWRPLRGREISLIFQNPVQSLNPSRTIGDQFTEAIRAHDPRSTRRECTERILSLFADVAFVSPGDPERVMKSYPFELSGGMCQRVMIAMALVHKPAFLIADEPTTSLDKKSEAQILTLFEKIRETCHTGILLISHDEELVRRSADRKIEIT